mmetsp:Transcript_18769/g.31424  ORF Transcript_18769/g.31424 Transcript_18769/m.31424 type:complete len:190 (-) Transcript_18769:132-701(-)
MKDAASSAQTQLEQQRTTVLQEAQSRVQQLEQEVQDYAVGKLETRTAELSKKVEAEILLQTKLDEVMLQNMKNTRSKDEMEAHVRELEKKLSNVSSNSQSLEAANTEAAQRVQYAEQQCQQLQQQVYTLQQNYQQMEAQCVNTQQQYMAVEGQYLQSQQQIEMLNAKVAEYQASLANLMEASSQVGDLN